MFGKMYPNCVKKKKKSESVDEVKPIKLKGKTGMGKISHLGMESVKEGVSKSQAQEIMRQLGGRKFEMLMGVKSKGVGKPKLETILRGFGISI